MGRPPKWVQQLLEKGPLNSRDQTRVSVVEDPPEDLPEDPPEDLSEDLSEDLPDDDPGTPMEVAESAWSFSRYSP